MDNDLHWWIGTQAYRLENGNPELCEWILSM